MNKKCNKKQFVVMRCTASIPNVIVSIHGTQFNCSQSRTVISAVLSVWNKRMFEQVLLVLGFFFNQFFLYCSNVHLSLLAFGGSVCHKRSSRLEENDLYRRWESNDRYFYVLIHKFRVSSKQIDGWLIENSSQCTEVEKTICYILTETELLC